MANQIASVAALLHSPDPGAFLGTCFPFRDPTCFLTAAHCAGELPAKELAIGLPMGDAGVVPVVAVERHPTADIALLRIAQTTAGEITPFWNLNDRYSLGDSFAAFGYTEDTFGPEPRLPVARQFRGHIQRVLRYVSPLGYEYDAAELSIGCPGGLSGGPIYLPNSWAAVVGVVTENLESTTYLQAVDEVQENGEVHHYRHQTMINYGIALLLDDLREWLDARAPMTTTSIPRGSGLLD
jgi:hypothetical protein